MAEQQVNVTTQTPTTAPGSAGLQTQVSGSPATVSSAAAATGGVAAGNFIEPDLDDELFKYCGDDVPLMQLMLKARRVPVTSPEVDHCAIDEERCQFVTTQDINEGNDTASLPVANEDKTLMQVCDTIICLGVDGYNTKGVKTPGKYLMLYVTSKDKSSGYSVVRAVNGPKTNETDAYSTIPAIPAGTKCVVLANALYETQKKVAPDLTVPTFTHLPLQKRGMNQIVSDYFNAQKKRIPFTEAVLAEAAIAKFKRKGNRTLWISTANKLQVETDEVGLQFVYFTEGIRWQFKKEVQHSGKWTYEEFIALAKIYYTGEDVPKSGLVLCGKNFMENIQCIDFSKHPEVNLSIKTNKLGWEVTCIHTTFGDFQFKREPTLDKLGYSNSAAIIGEDRLVHYVYSKETNFKDKVDGEEAKRTGVLVWDGLGLKGSCHLFVNCEGYDNESSDVANIEMWDSEEAPTTTASTTSPIYYLMQDCPGIGNDAKKGEMWQYDGSAWSEVTGVISAE